MTPNGYAQVTEEGQKDGEQMKKDKRAMTAEGRRNLLAAALLRAANAAYAAMLAAEQHGTIRQTRQLEKVTEDIYKLYVREKA